ncbi:MAG: o-succinylbenzoate synthase [Hyphomicrobiales bacterium]
MPRIRRVRWRPFRIPFRREFRAAYGTIDAREGFVVQAEDAEGHSGLGEALPLTAFTGETLDDAARFLGAWLGELAPGARSEAPATADWPDPPPSAAAAIECALLDMAAHRSGRILARYISRATETPGPPRSPVPVNGVLPIGEPAGIAEAARGLWAEGFRTFKLKAGADRDANVAAVAAVRDALGPDAALGLDANGAWTEDEAVRQLSALRDFGLELVEQPVAPGPGDLAAMARIREATGVPVAADESLAAGSVDIEAVLAAVDAVVLKPAIHGAAATHDLLRAAVKAGKRAIVTTTFDTGIGTALATHLAALLPEPRPACGLDTLRFLEGDIVSGLPLIADGCVSLSVRPGLGLSLDEDALERFATGPWHEVQA